MSTKAHPPDYVTQAAELLRRIYEDRNPPTTFRERVKLTHWLHKLAERDAKIQWPCHHGKAELLLMVAEAGVYVLPFIEAVTELYEKAKDRPQEEKAPAAGKPAPKFDPTGKQKEAAAALRRMYKAPRSRENVVDRSIRNRTTRALKHLRRIVRDDAPGRALPEHTDADSLYLEACRVRFEGVKTLALRGALDSVESMAFEAQEFWRGAGRQWQKESERQEKAEGKPQVRGRDKSLYTIRLQKQIGNCGFIGVELVQARGAVEPKVGEIGVAWVGDEEALLGRVVASDADSITLRDEFTDYTFKRSEVAFLGRADPEPVGRHDGLSEEQRKRREELLTKLERLDGEDDQILRCTKRYELEKELFDIEHPAGGDPDDWSAWEEGGEA